MCCKDEIQEKIEWVIYMHSAFKTLEVQNGMGYVFLMQFMWLVNGKFK